MALASFDTISHTNHQSMTANYLRGNSNRFMVGEEDDSIDKSLERIAAMVHRRGKAVAALMQYVG